MRNVHMTKGHESQKPPFFFSSESISHTQTVGNDSLDDVVVGQDDSFGITCLSEMEEQSTAKVD